MGDTPEHANPSSLCWGIEGSYSLGLHIAAIFVVLGASVLGTLLPLISKCVPFLRRNPFIFVVAKTAATGVLLSVSTIHLINDAILNFQEECVPGPFQESYQAYGFLFALIGALMMHLVDYQLAEIAERWMKRRAEQLKKREDACLNGADCCEPGKEHETNPVSPCAHEGEAEPCGRAEADTRSISPYGAEEEAEAAEDEHSAAEERLPGCGHSHEIAVPVDMPHIQRIIAAVCMEFGVTLHSIFVGLDIGLTTDSVLKPLLVALVFHQLFEGMSLGSRLVDARFKIALELILAFVFSFSAPLGMVAATIAVSVNGSSMSGGGFVMMMGILSSFCGGILLYLAFNLLFSDFNAEMKVYCGEDKPHRTRRKVIMFVALWVGMGAMALVGKWL